MTEGRRWLVWAAVVTLVFLLLAWLHRLFVVDPLDVANKDFMSLWTGGRAVLLGLNPYDLEVWRPLRAAFGSTWMPDPRAPFPLWTFLFTVPFGALPLPLGAAAWLALEELLLALNLLLLAGVVAGYRPAPLDVGLLAVGAFLSISLVLVLINGQMTYVLLTALTLFLLWEEERPFWAGFALAFLAFKPNPFILFLPLAGLWLLQRRRWPVIAGGAAGGFFLLAASWLVQPGWLGQWLNVRSKTEVVTITPTVWGLAAELSFAWWLPLGLLLTVVLTAAAGWFAFTRKTLSPFALFSLAIPASLLTTPYTWAYEHALLLIPWLWIYTRLPRRPGRIVWLLLAWLLPWALFLVAAARLRDTLSFLVPLATLAAVWSISARSAGQPSSRKRGGPSAKG